jgi:UDP-2-acetamido-3-amino-2,3-dideoxy-glucuronate N-acetyltransferase
MTGVAPTGFYAHPSAVIEDGAAVGTDTKIWHFAHVRAGASIGERCTLGKDVFVDAGASVGNDCKIQNGVSIYSGVTIDDEVFVGPHVVFTNDRCPRAISPTWEIVPTRVLVGSSVGANATIVCGTVIGAYAMVAAGAVVTHDVADFELVMGNPARHAGWVCHCGRVCSRGETRPERFECELHESSGTRLGGTT